MLVQEITTIKPTAPKTPAQARVRAMTQNVDKARDALAAEKNLQTVSHRIHQIATALHCVNVRCAAINRLS